MRFLLFIFLDIFANYELISVRSRHCEVGLIVLLVHQISFILDKAIGIEENAFETLMFHLHCLLSTEVDRYGNK